MKLVSFSQMEAPPRIGAIIEDTQESRVCDLAAASVGYRKTKTGGGFLLPQDMRDFLKTGVDGLALAAEVLDWVAQSGYATASIDTVTLLAPVPRPSKVLALAGNYQDHIVEGGGIAIEKSKIVPQLFMKPPTTIGGPNQPVRLPVQVSQKVDWELELAVVIGRAAKYVAVEQALDFAAGYTIFNDISSRSLEITSSREEQRPRDAFFDWLNGKWQDGFGLMGPYLVTTDEIPDPQNSSLRLLVNGEVRQEGSTNQMIFNVAETISWASKLATLEPGDVIATGTPAGVGSASSEYLKSGDILCGEIEGLGRLTNKVVNE